MRYIGGFTSLLIFSLCSFVLAQPAFEVIDLEGTAKTQRVQKHKWEKLSAGAKLSDNDIIETYFQTKLSIRLSDGTIVLFGSNSKALLNISSKENMGRKTTDASFSLFNGGILAKAISKTKIRIFTTNAVGEIDSGTLSVVVNTKSGETGFLVIGGKVVVRNISQQKGMELDAGYTTIVIPGREPAPPLALSFRHAAILRHFFGDKLITEELRVSSITLANDQTGNIHATVSAGSGTDREKVRTDLLSYQRVFNKRNIYGSILEDRENTERLYRPVSQQVFSADAKGSMELRGNVGLTDHSSSLAALLPKYRFPYIETGLRFVLGDDYRSEFVTGFNSTAALLDKIEHITAGSVDDSLYLTAGTLYDLTFGNGLLVNHFRNTENNDIYHPFGLNGKVKILDRFKIDAFLANVAAPSPMGLHATYEISSYTFGAGLYYDPSQYLHLNDSEDLRYTRYSSGAVFPDTTRIAGKMFMYEINFSTAIADYYNRGLDAVLDFAQKRENGLNDGYISRPTLILSLPFYTFGAGMVIENGRLLSGEFDEFYSSRHAYLKQGTNLDTLLTLNTALDKKRYVTSLRFIFKANPLKSMDIDMCYTQAFGSKNAYAFRVSDTASDSVKNRRINTPLDFSFDFRCSIGDKLIPLIYFADLYMRQSHARLYPPSGSFLSSWNSEAGFDVTSKPLFFNLSLMLGGRFFYIDKGPNPNDNLDATDRVFELSAGIRWDFL
jgi:hypothetical protein